VTQKQILDRAFVNTVNALRGKEKAYLGDLREVYRQALHEVLGTLQGYYRQAGTITPFLFGRASEIARVVTERLLALGQDTLEGLSDHLKDIYTESYYRSAWAADLATPPSLAIRFSGLPETQVLAAIATPWKGEMFSQRWFRITDQMARNMQREIATGIALGESLDDTAERIEDLWGKTGSGLEWRAEMIARTETIRAREVGRIKVFMDNSDLVLGDYWVTMEDELVCPICEPLNGKENVPEEPPIHPNCRCTKLKDWDDLWQPGDPEEPIYQPFEAWKEAHGLGD